MQNIGGQKLKNLRKYGAVGTILIVGIVLMLLYRIPMLQTLYDDIIMFKKIEEPKIQNKFETPKPQSHIQYVFDVTSDKIEFQNINLIDSLKRESTLNDMLAPGIEGAFDVVLNTNINADYKINFKSSNQKPKNLKFQISETNTITNSLDDLNIQGYLQKNAQKTINIRWYWDYENTKEGNFQDTLDSKNIQNYSFTICAVGEQRG